MGKKSVPEPPDYAAAAERTAGSDYRNLQSQTYSNRPTQNTPFGQSSWEVQQGTPGQWNENTKNYEGFTPDQWTQNTTLNPESQRALDSQLTLTADKSELAGSLTERMQDEFGTAQDWSKFMPFGGIPEAQKYDTTSRYYDKAGDALYGRATSRLDPQFSQREEQLQARLANQGLQQGDEAYNTAIENFQRDRTDAYQQAGYNADIGAGAEASRMSVMDLTSGGQQFGQEMSVSNLETQQRQQQISEEAQKRGLSLNEMNAIMSGQQVALPSMPNFTQGGKAMATDYSGAAKNQFDSAIAAGTLKNQQLQTTMGGVTDLAGGAMSFSDRRLKRGIVYLGKILGHKWYRWTYLWGEKGCGVMSDEIPQEFVYRHESGYDMVNYGGLLNGRV